MVKKSEASVQWEAKEHIEQQHNYLWYLGLVAVVAGFSALAIWQGWWTFLILIILSGIAVLISAIKPPRIIKYSLDSKGLTEDGIMHRYEEFRAFGILQEGNNYSAVLIPKKRLGLQVKIYFPEVDGEQIVDMLGMRLPMEEIKLDFLDKIVNFLRI